MLEDILKLLAERKGEKEDKLAKPELDNSTGVIRGQTFDPTAEYADYKYLKDMKEANDFNNFKKGRSIGLKEGAGSLLGGISELGAVKGLGALAGLIYPEDSVSNDEEMVALDKFKKENPEAERSPASEAKMKALMSIREKNDEPLLQKIAMLGKNKSEYPTKEEYEEKHQMSVDTPRLDDEEGKKKLMKLLRGE